MFYIPARAQLCVNKHGSTLRSSVFNWSYWSSRRCSAEQQNILSCSPEILLPLWRAWNSVSVRPVWWQSGAPGGGSASWQCGRSEVSPAQRSIESSRGVCQFCSSIRGVLLFLFPPLWLECLWNSVSENLSAPSVVGNSQYDHSFYSCCDASLLRSGTEATAHVSSLRVNTCWPGLPAALNINSYHQPA